MTPNAERTMARQHLTDAAESLRVAGERLCDWLEATMEAQVLTACCYDCGLLYGSAAWADCVVAPDVWEQLSPTGDEGGLLCFTCMTRRAVRLGLTDVPLRVTSGPWADGAAGVPATAREVLTQLVNEFTDGTIGDPFRLTPAQRARMLGYIDREYAAPTPTPPPIPPGAVVEVEGDANAPYTRRDGWWEEGTVGSPWRDADQWGRASLITALYHARREMEEERANPLRTVTVYGIGGKPSPAPSAPRRWWLVVDRDGYPVYAYASQRLAVERVQEDNENVPRPAFTPYSVVPVIEARVTREMVGRVVKAMRDDPEKIYHSMARAALTALGLTVEE